MINIRRDYSGDLLRRILSWRSHRWRRRGFVIDKLAEDEKRGEENREDMFVSFAYRYKYIDGDYSALSFLF